MQTYSSKGDGNNPIEVVFRVFADAQGWELTRFYVSESKEQPHGIYVSGDFANQDGRHFHWGGGNPENLPEAFSQFTGQDFQGPTLAHLIELAGAIGVAGVNEAIEAATAPVN